MINEVINLRPENPNVTLTAYVCDDVEEAKPRTAVLVCPGGGYSYCADHEGEKIALNYLAAGFNAFVLKYSVKRTSDNFKYPMPLVDASNAMKYIKDNAERYNIDKDKVFVCGFSAGGHLASMLGTIWHRDEVYAAAQKMEYGYNKPAGMILCYPVIHPKGHPGSFRCLLGEGAEPERLCSISSHMNVDKRTCPAFLWHVSDDISVDVESSIDMAVALKRAGIKFEMHIYPEGGHGLGLPDGMGSDRDYPDVVKWMENSVRWIKAVSEKFDEYIN